MANTGNTQQIIDYGAAPNDGTGDPLRTAFIKTDENFDNVWLAGPVGSNITIANNTVQSNNTNGNIILKPNGVGVIQANAAIVPSAANVRDIGTSSLPFRAGYFGVGGLRVDGNVTVTGNLTAGNISYTGNVFVGDLQGSVFADDSTLMVDAINNTLYAEDAFLGAASATGNITANYFIGNGSLLTGITSTYGNANVASYLPTYTGNISANNINIFQGLTVANVFTANGVYGQFGAFTGLNGRGIDAIQAGVEGGTFLGTDVIVEITGNSNAYTQFNFQNINTGTQASTDYVITANNGNDIVHFLNIGVTNSNWDGTQDNSLGNLLGPDDGYFYVQDGDLVLGTKNGNTAYTWKWDTTGNVTATGNLIPSANLTYSLGNSTNWWSNIWVAANTIYIGGVSLGVTGNTLTVAGEPVLSNDSTSSISTTGNITAGNIITNGIYSDDSTVLTVYDGLNVDGDIEAAGNISGNTAGYAIGYRDIPQISFTGNATIATADAGKHFYSTQSTDYILTIANNASQGFQVGAAISIVNQGTGNITIAQGSGVTLYLAGNATSGNRTLSTFGMATIMKVATDTWFINGTSIS